MESYYAAGAFAGVAGVTTEMALEKEFRERNFAGITACARRWTEAVRKMKAG
jgi:hypothetical protein